MDRMVAEAAQPKPKPKVGKGKDTSRHAHHVKETPDQTTPQPVATAGAPASWESGPSSFECQRSKNMQFYPPNLNDGLVFRFCVHRCYSLYITTRPTIYIYICGYTWLSSFHRIVAGPLTSLTWASIGFHLILKFSAAPLDALVKPSMKVNGVSRDSGVSCHIRWFSLANDQPNIQSAEWQADVACIYNQIPLSFWKNAKLGNIRTSRKSSSSWITRSPVIAKPRVAIMLAAWASFVAEAFVKAGVWLPPWGSVGIATKVLECRQLENTSNIYNTMGAELASLKKNHRMIIVESCSDAIYIYLVLRTITDIALKEYYIQ